MVIPKNYILIVRNGPTMITKCTHSSYELFYSSCF